MNPHFHGDAYEFPKRALIQGLAPLNGWAIHPMYYDFVIAPHDPNFAADYADFLGIELLQRGECPRDHLVEACNQSRDHLFLDPDTGLWRHQRRPRGGWIKHIGIHELAQIACAPGREKRLTLVFDQSMTRAENRTPQIEQKLATLRNLCPPNILYAVAYVSQCAFIWVSRDLDLIHYATDQLIAATRIPRCRFVGLGAL